MRSARGEGARRLALAGLARLGLADHARRDRATSRRRRRHARGRHRRQPCLVATTLDLDSIPSITVEIRSPNRRRVAVSVDDRGRVLQALHRHAPPTTYLYLDERSIPARHRLQHLARWTRRNDWRAQRANVWRVFEFLADPGGTDVLGDLHGCEIEF